MLQAIRDRTTGIIAWVIITILIIPFVVVVFVDYDFGTGGVPAVAYIDGKPVTKQEFDDSLRNRKEYHKQQHKIAVLRSEEEQYKREILEQLTQSHLVLNAAMNMGYHAGPYRVDPFIRQHYLFRGKNGVFDQEEYNRFFSRGDITEKQFRKQISDSMINRQFQYAIIGSEFLTKQELNNLLKVQNRKIEFNYFVIPAKSFASKISVTDAEIKQYYDKNNKDFMTQKRYQISYLEMVYADFYKAAKPTEADIKKYYEENGRFYRKPAIRKAANIFFKAKPGDKKQEAAALKRAIEVYSKLKSGEKFEDLLKKYSDDKLSKDGDLGVIDKTANETFYNAISNLKVGQFTPPVKGKKGYYILKVTFMKPGEVKKLEDVKQQVMLAAKKKLADDAYRKMVSDVYDKTYANPENLTVAAKEFKLEVKSTDWFTRDKPVGIAKHKQVLGAMLDAEVFANGNPVNGVNSNIVEIRDTQQNTPRKRGEPVKPKSPADDKSVSYIIRLKAYDKPKLKSLDSVKAEIKTLLEKKKMAEMAKAKGKELFAIASKESKLDTAAKKGGYAVKKSGKVGRNSVKPDRDIVRAVFKSGVPQKDKTLLQEAQLDNGDVVVFQVTTAEEGAIDKLTKQKRLTDSQRYARYLANVEFNALVAYLRANAKIEVVNKNLNSEPDK